MKQFLVKDLEQSKNRQDNAIQLAVQTQATSSDLFLNCIVNTLSIGTKIEKTTSPILLFTVCNQTVKLIVSKSKGEEIVEIVCKAAKAF